MCSVFNFSLTKTMMAFVFVIISRRAIEARTPNITEQVDSTSPAFHLHSYHIAKCGGSTFSREAPKFLGTTSCNTIGGIALYGVPPSEFAAKLNSTKGSGQCGFSSFEGGYVNIAPYLPEHHYSHVNFREPHNWVWSAIFHDYRRKRIAKGKRDFTIDEIIGPNRKDSQYNYNNYQTRWLTEVRKPNLADVQRAMAIVDGMDVVGVVEFYHESMCLIAYKFLRMDFFNTYCASCSRPKDVGYRSYNVGISLKKNGFFGTPDDIDEINDLVFYDQILYSYVLQRFLADVNAVQKASGKTFLC